MECLQVDDIRIYFEQIASELSFIRDHGFECDWNTNLHYCKTIIKKSINCYQPKQEDLFLYELITKSLSRGIRPFVSYYAEKFIIDNYGAAFFIKSNDRENSGSIRYSFSKELRDTYERFNDLLEPWSGKIGDLEFDPQHPDNEQAFFIHLLKKYGSKIASCLEMQVNIDRLVDLKTAKEFAGQRVDFILSFPNGKGLILEPGDHEDPRQVSLDDKRDNVFESNGVKTVRFRNEEIKNDQVYKRIDQHLNQLNVKKYLISNNYTTNPEKTVAANYLFLLPSLVSRIEKLLAYFWFKEGLVHKSNLRVGIIERDLQCAEVGLASFLDHVSRLLSLYGINYVAPKIELNIIRNDNYRYKAVNIDGINIKECEDFKNKSFDLLLDVGIKCNINTKPSLNNAELAGAVRQSFCHNEPVKFGYLSKIREIHKDNMANDDLLNSFLQDYFRKYKMREGQKEIIVNILSQKSTIGLLPTSAGKSICYQLASIVTPGITFVVDPIIALMNDQVQGLSENFGIDRVIPWYAGSDIKPQDVENALMTNFIVFISPERLLRPKFREAMSSINAADIYTNYAVIDEAHCVSMWGHDFRPSYLMLDMNFQKYLTFQGRSPVVVALTGTASQLVLIDLKRELNIQNLDSIIRPKTFDRRELKFNLLKCRSEKKKQFLNNAMVAIARRLNVQRLDQDACGIVFAYRPKEVWDLFGEQVSRAKDYVRTVLNDEKGENLVYGFYSGSAPDGLALSKNDFDMYKNKTLKAFKRGDIRMLFGNTAVSVGIDNEELNYVINYKMPQSMEAYYQQCGRAGRAGQHSECYLIFSDDYPELTQSWLNREVESMENRWDDIGTVAYFHNNNFPGKDKDTQASFNIFRHLFKEEADHKQLVKVPMYFKDNLVGSSKEDKRIAERTERYISYWLMLGILEDYEVIGSDGKSTNYYVKIHDVIKKALKDNRKDLLKIHLIEHLYKYLNRYRPIQLEDLEKDIEARPEKDLSKKCISYLIQFIYEQIEYQRREAIRTMVSYCNQDDNSPDKLRAIVKAYFDSSDKFSKLLSSMADTELNFNKINEVLEIIDGFDDAELLYWETRRLLDERFRADWSMANLFSQIYREAGAYSEKYSYLIDSIISSFTEIHRLQRSEELRFFANYLSYYKRLDDEFGDDVSVKIQSDVLAYLYSYYGLIYTKIIDLMDVPEENRDIIRLKIINIQLKEIIDERYSRVIG